MSDLQGLEYSYFDNPEFIGFMFVWLCFGIVLHVVIASLAAIEPQDKDDF